MLLYQIGLTLIPGVGDVNGKKLVAYCGSAEAVFKAKKAHLLKIPGVGNALVSSIFSQDVLKRAEEEINFITKHKIQPLFYLNDEYPERLKHCADSPMMLYLKGNVDLNKQKVISIVGTRQPTDYGLQVCKQLLEGLAGMDILVVSGLAYGIDICAHKAALANGLPTLGVVAHGLDRVYPALHKPTAIQMIENNGGLLTDYISGTKPDRENFPSRNRIVAGMTDATIIIESAIKGGALITAEIANSYSRDVFAVPGRITDFTSKGCHYLIKNNKAALLETTDDLLKMMNWDEPQQKQKIKQQELFVNLSDDEQKLVDMIRKNEECSVDYLCSNSEFTMSKVSALLLNLEFSGIVNNLPGKMYRLK